MIDYDIQEDLYDHLDTGEKLLWTGKPKTGVVFRKMDIFMIPFSILWCGFAIFWFVTALTMGAPFFFALFGVPFILIGLMMVFGRFIVDAKQRENTVYAITDNRVIIKSGIFSKKVQSLNIKTLSNVEMSEKVDGWGTITFGTAHPYSRYMAGMSWWPGVQTAPELQMVKGVREVNKIIIEIQKD